MSSKEEIVYRAKLAEQAERYEDMAKAMKEVVEMGNGSSALTVEERNLLSVAYKNVIGARRASWRIISSIEAKNEQQSEGDNKHALATKLRSEIEEELTKICKEITDMLSNKLIPGASGDDEAEVFYNKMKGDYHRYEAEFKEESQKHEPTKQSLEAYQTAHDKAEKNLTATHPIRLGLALNFSVFYYEIKKDPTKACSLARKAFDDAIANLDNLGEDSYKDSTLIMQLLRDNLTLWASDNENLDKDDEEQQQEAN